MSDKTGLRRLKRLRYFAGQLLTADHFRAEQEYFLERNRRHNRLFHGFGVVTGLEVSAQDDTVTVSPGMALDGYGNEIVMEHCSELRLRRGPRAVYVVTRYCESEVDPVPAVGPDQTQENSRVEESFELATVSSHPLSNRKRRETPSVEDLPRDAVPLARLLFTRGKWKLDRSFRRPKAN